MKLLKITPETAVVEDTLAERDDLDATDIAPTDVKQVSPAVSLQQYLGDLDRRYRAGKNPNIPLDFGQRLDLALKDSKRALEVSNSIGWVMNNLSQFVQRGFADINMKLERIASGQSLTNPDEYGTSIFDE